MELEQLRQLDAIAREGTMSAAARALHLSQPALSRSLARLEAELDQPLFDRPGRRLVLTDAGRVALEHARQILRDERAMRAAVDDVARRTRALGVGTVAPAPPWRLTALMVERFPGLVLTSQMLAEAQVQAGIRDGGLDLGIALRPAAPPGVRSCRLMVENLSVALPDGHALAERAGVRAAELAGETCLLFEGIFPMEQYNASSSTPPTTRQSSYLYPRLMQSVEDIRHAKALLFGGGDSKATGTEAPAEATPASK